MNAAASTDVLTSPAVRTYLRRATWGLPKARQQELWDELEEHLLTRTAHLQVLGASPPEALDLALAELGSPGRVSAGMTQVYLMPKLLIAAGTVALTLSAVLYAVAAGNGQTLSLPVLTTQPMTPSCLDGNLPVGYRDNFTLASRKNGLSCYTRKTPDRHPSAYLSQSSIKKAVIAQGGVMHTIGHFGVTIHLPNKEKPYTEGVPISFTVNGEAYFLASNIARIFSESQPSSAYFQGYSHPALVVNKLRLQIGNGSKLEVAQAFYREVGQMLLGRVLHKDGGSYHVTPLLGSEMVSTHQFKTNLVAGEVMMLVTHRAGLTYDLAVAPVEADGSVTLNTAQRRLYFVSTPAQLAAGPNGGRSTAVLVRLTHVPLNDLDSGIFVPAQVNSDAP